MGQSNQEPIVSFEQAKALKALAFNWSCDNYFLHSHPDPKSGSGQDWNSTFSFTSCPTEEDAKKWIELFAIPKAKSIQNELNEMNKLIELIAPPSVTGE
jgi:hypothetical protein